MYSPNHAALIEGLSTAVVTLDEGLRFMFLNPAAEELLGTSWRHAAGRTFPELLPKGGAIAELLRACLESMIVRTHREITLPLTPARSVLVDLTVTPLDKPDEDEAALLLEIACHAGRQQASLDEPALQHRHELSRQLARGLAHEIKNPLGGLRGAAQLLGRETHDPALREYIDVIIDEADRLTALLDRLLGPRAGPHPEPTNIHLPLEHVRTLVAAGHEGIEIETDYDPSLPEIMVDVDQLVQAMLNIMLNAVQAMQGEGRICIRTRSQRQKVIGQRPYRIVARIDIVDEGPGIPETIAGDIFLPMISGRANGSGLGLPIAQQLVQNNGGIIECQSEPGRTVFSVYLPIEHNG